MKNFPHQFNDLTKLFNALAVAQQLINNNITLTDDHFGSQLTRESIYTYRDKTLSIDQFLEAEAQKPASNRGYLTVSRDIRRFFELLGFITVFPDKTARLSPAANQLLQAPEGIRKSLWKNALLQLGLEDQQGTVSHPYRILLKIVNTFPGIETPKLMLALEARDDSEAEFERIAALVGGNIDQIIQQTGTSPAMAANAVKILPGIAEQLNDIERRNSRAYPIGQLIITEDEITTEEEETKANTRADFRAIDSANIARDPNLNAISSVSIDLTDAIKIRQQRLVQHQEIVRRLALINEQKGFNLFEGKIDCLAVKDGTALLYEVKTILDSFPDQEKQSVKGIGQLKYYSYSIVNQQMAIPTNKQILVYSRKPHNQIIEFASVEEVFVVWRNGDAFDIHNPITGAVEVFNPDNII